MAVYVSSHSVIGKVFRDFKPQNSSFEGDAPEWIGEALDMLKLTPAQISKTSVLNIEHHKVKLPCDIISIGGVSISNIDGTNIGGTQFEPYQGIAPIERVNSVVQDINYPFYSQKGKFLHFKFENGSGELYYYGLPVDDCGYPLIPDDSFLTEALSWYILMKWLGQGNVHPVFTYEIADAKWGYLYPRAQNSIKRITPEKMAVLLTNWVQLLPRITRHKEFFTGQSDYVSDNLIGGDINQFLGTKII